MAVWRCPHCAAPQPESSRCWVCHRSTTTCSTCRHFRRAVVQGLGLCGRDRRRLALTGHEIRGCWTAVPPDVPDDARERVSVGPGRPDPASPRRTFVPVDTFGLKMGAAGTTEAALARAADLAPATGSGRRVPGAWWLWGDPDPWPEG